MKRIVFMAVALLFLFALRAQAEEAKIAFVDMGKVVNGSVQWKEALQTLSNLKKAKESILIEKSKEIEKLEEEILKQASILSQAILNEKKEKLKMLKDNVEELFRKSQDELARSESELGQKIVMDVRKIIEKIARKDGYTLILDKNAVLYSPSEYDLTEKVFKEYNEASKTEKMGDK